MAGVRGLYQKLRERRVFRVGAIYAVAAFAVLQACEIIFPALLFPAWALRLLVVCALLGFPVALSAAWTFGGPPRSHHLTVATGIVLLLSTAAALVWGARWVFRGTAGTTARAPADKSVAVMPFANLSADPENEYFSDGVSEEILTTLTKIDGLKVAAHDSAFAFKGKHEAARAIAQQLGVATLVEGSVRKANGRLRISARLVNASDGFELWAETYDREARDIFAVQDEIARAVAQALKVRLVDGSGTVVAPQQSATLDAHDLYLRGRFAFNQSQGAREGLERALELYRQSTEKDPHYAMPWAGISEAYIWLADQYLPPREAYPKAKQAAQKAIELDPAFGRAYVFRGSVELIYDWDWKTAEADDRHGVELAPGDAACHFYYSNYFIIRGQVERAREELAKSMALDPFNPLYSHFLGLFQLWTGHPDEALALAKHTEELAPDMYYITTLAGDVYREQGALQKAVAVFQREEQTQKRPSWGLAATYGRMGESAKAREIADQLIALAKTTYVPADRIAAIYANVGDVDRAFTWLETGFQQRDTWLTWFHVMPEFAPLRKDPRYQQLLARIGLQ